MSLEDVYMKMLRAYLKARAEEKESFMLGAQEVVTGYAMYRLEYEAGLPGRIKLKNAVSRSIKKNPEHWSIQAGTRL